MDVWDDTSTSDGSLDKSVELFVTSDSELEMSWSDSLNLKIFGSVTGELKNLSGQVLKDSGAVNCGSSSNSAVGADSALQDSVDSSNWELRNTKNYVSNRGGILNDRIYSGVGSRIRSTISVTVTLRCLTTLCHGMGLHRSWGPITETVYRICIEALT